MVPLTETRLADLWGEAKEIDSEKFWGAFEADTLQMVKRLLESSLEAEMIQRLGADWYERTPQRQGWRNGYYQRDVLLKQGLVSQLQASP